MKLKRSAKITVETLSGNAVIQAGHEAARRLWNFAWYCAIGYNRKVSLWRWKNQIKSGPYPKYPGKYGMDKIMRDTDEGHALSDRCFSTVIQELDIAIRSWWSNLKSNPDARPPRYSREPRQLTFEVGRNAKPIGNWVYRLTVLGSGIQDRHTIVKLHVRPRLKMSQVKLIRVQPDGTGTVVFYAEQDDRAGDGIAALDVGIINLAALAFQDGASILYSGRGLLSRMQWYEKKAAKCKPRGWQGKGDSKQGGSRRYNAYKRKAGNVRKLAVHNLTRNIIDECIEHSVGTLVVGDLTGIREGKDHGKRNNQKLHQWPFAELRRQLEYKAEEVGIEVVAISEAYTSKSCHFCGAIGRRIERGRFECRDCGVSVNADLNGAANILKKYLLAQKLEVGAILPGPPSPPERAARIGAGAQATAKEAWRPFAIDPTFVARFDLRNWSVTQARCNGNYGG